MLVGDIRRGVVTRGRFRPCMSPRSLPCTAQTICLERRTSRAAAHWGAHVRTRRAPSHLCTDGVPGPTPKRRRSAPRRLTLSQDPHLHPPRTRGQRCDSRVRRRSGLRMLTRSGSGVLGRSPFPLPSYTAPVSRDCAGVPIRGLRSAQSRVGRSYTACMAGSIISKETSPFEVTFSFSSRVDVRNTSW